MSHLSHVQELIDQGASVLRTYRAPTEFYEARAAVRGPTVDEGLYAEWRSSARAFLTQNLGAENTYTHDFMGTVGKIARHKSVKAGLGILRGVLRDLENGAPRSHTSGSDVDSKLVIVIAPSDLEDNFEVIASVCKGHQLKASRVEHKGSSAPIVERILKSLQEARFVVADLTSARPNVYYELGYFDAICWARNIDPADRLLIIAQSESDIHFDIQHRGVQRYNDPVSLLKMASKWLGERIQSTSERE